MLGKVLCLIRLAALKAKYGKRLHFGKEKQTIRYDTEIKAGKNAQLSIDGISVGTNVHLICEHGEMNIGKGAIFNRNCIVVCQQKINIGINCLFGPNVCIYDHDHVFTAEGVFPYELECSEIIIEDGCWIGAGAIILRGTHIGRNTVIGAGTIVKGKIPPSSLVFYSRKNKTIPLRYFKNKPKTCDIVIEK